MELWRAARCHVCVTDGATSDGIDGATNGMAVAVHGADVAVSDEMTRDMGMPETSSTVAKESVLTGLTSSLRSAGAQTCALGFRYVTD